MLSTTDDLRIKSLTPIVSPAILIQEQPLSVNAAKLVQKARNEAEAIVKGQDDRLLVVVGPCSIHDTDAALEYAHRLQKQMYMLQSELCIIMRVYFEKPRTTIGWKGLINDPNLDNSFDINKGLRKARGLLTKLADLGIPSATEFLDTIIPQYIADTVAWGAIGARTTESQIHRELASGLSMPIGFKNGTDGNIKIAIDAIGSAQHPHHFLSVSKVGVPVIVATEGNDSTHVILRGSNSGPNYEEHHINKAVQTLKENNLNPSLMVDCSHGNSNKDHEKQLVVTENICEQIASGSRAIFGVMLESNLIAGKQALIPGKHLTYGQSITDACLSWEDTICALEKLASAVQLRRATTKWRQSCQVANS